MIEFDPWIDDGGRFRENETILGEALSALRRQRTRMMLIHLPEDLKSSIEAAIRDGRYASIDDAMTDAARLLVANLERLSQPSPGLANSDHDPVVDSARPVADEPNPASARKPIWEVFQEIAAGIPDDVWDRIPADSSEQLDHYIYGTPKRPTTP